MRYCLSIEAHALAISTKNVPATRAEMTMTTEATTYFSIEHCWSRSPDKWRMTTNSDVKKEKIHKKRNRKYLDLT